MASEDGVLASGGRVAVGGGGIVAVCGGSAQADTPTQRRTTIVETNRFNALTWPDLGWDTRSLLTRIVIGYRLCFCGRARRSADYRAETVLEVGQMSTAPDTFSPNPLYPFQCLKVFVVFFAADRILRREVEDTLTEITVSHRALAWISLA